MVNMVDDTNLSEAEIQKRNEDFQKRENALIEKEKRLLIDDLKRNNYPKLSTLNIKSGEDSDLNLNMEFRGIGLNPEKDIDVGGYLYITKIGSRFTDNFLTSLDPKGVDKSIKETKRLLDWGYKPKLISFEIKHGNMYPTIFLTKGSLKSKLIPVNLSGGKIELARIPLKFFLETNLTPQEY